MTINKEITITVGNYFDIDPWDDAKRENRDISRYTCKSTKCFEVNSTAFSIVETKRTETQYKISTIPQAEPVDGFYCQYRITALKVGTYTIKARANSTHIVYGPKSSTIFNDCTTFVYTVTVEPQKIVKSITIPSTLTLTIGNSYTFSPEIVDKGATTTLTWTSSNTSVVTVNSNTIKAIGVGSSTVKCTASNGVSASCVVKVNPIYVNQVTLNITAYKMEKLETMQLTATVSPTNATNKSVTWSTSDKNIATVDSKGFVTALATGSCTIKATTNDGSGKSAVCYIEVVKDNTLIPKNLTICKGSYDALHVYINNTNVISGFQFDLQLPSGFTVQEKSGGILSTKLADFASGYSVSSNKISEGLYRFIVVSLSGKSISARNEEIMTIDIKSSNAVTEGDFEFSLKNMILTVKNGTDLEELKPIDRKAIITVAPITPGDVNGDSNISVTDVISIISYVLDERPNKFLTPAADMNGDEKISVTDAISLIDKILEKNNNNNFFDNERQPYFNVYIPSNSR